MSTLTKQQVFSRVYHHFIDMRNARGLNEHEACAYRGTHGSRCAVGLFMTDEEAKKADINEIGITCILRNDLCGELAGQDAEFILNLQAAHDTGFSSLTFEKNLRAVAKKHDLLVIGVPKELATPAHGLDVCSCGALGARSWNGRWAPQCRECYDTEMQERMQDFRMDDPD